MGSKETKIKVLRVITRLNIGGPAIHVSLLTEGLDPGRFTTLLVTGNLSDHEGDMSYLVNRRNVTHLRIPELHREVDLKQDMLACFKLLRIIVREKPDIVHTHTAKAGTVGRLAAFLYNALFRRRVRTVHTFHGHVFHGYFGKLKSSLFLAVERALAARTDAIIAISRTQREELAHTFRIAAPERIRQVNLGFDLSPFFSCHEAGGRFRERIGVDAETILIAVVGRLVPIKNHKMFFHAARKLLERSGEKRLTFLVIGDGELRDWAEACVRGLGLADHVRFCGWIQEIHSVFADLDILALTSLNEGTPVSIIEAMASSVPVIATDAGGVRDLLGPQEDTETENGFALCRRGIRCEVDDAEGLAGGLLHLLENRDGGNEARVERARAFVEEHYASSRLIHRMESIYEELTTRGPQEAGGSPGRTGDSTS
jgi:glycosyltransferase involved in cell wall biosynthesis